MAAWFDEMQDWGIQIQQQPSHENHTDYELNDDNTIRINSERVEGEIVFMTTESYGDPVFMPVFMTTESPMYGDRLVAGKVTKVPQNSRLPTSEPFWTRIGPALGMNEARWKHFTTHLKKKCSGGDRPILHVMGVAKSREAIGEGITLSVERPDSNLDPLLGVERRESEPSNIDPDDSDINVHKVAADALGQAIDNDSDGLLDLGQAGEVLAGLDENSAQNWAWTATAAEYLAPQEAYFATTHVSRVSSVEIMRSKSGRETIEVLQTGMGNFGLTYNDDGGSIHRQLLGSVLEMFGKADQSESQLFVSVYDTASKTKMCNHVHVDKIRKCKNGYRLYLRKGQNIASTTMTGKSKRAMVMLYGYDHKSLIWDQAPQSRPGGAAPGGAAHTDQRLGRILLKVEPEGWDASKEDVTVSLDAEVARNQRIFGTMQKVFLSNGCKTVLATVKSVESDGSKTMVKMDLPGDAYDAWTKKKIPYLTMKGITMAMPAKPLALKLTLAADSVEDEPVYHDLVAEITEVTNAAIDASDIVDLADIDEILDESGQGQGDVWGVTGVDVFNGFPGYGQTKSSVVNKIGATVWASSDGKKTYIDIDQDLVGRGAMIHKSTLKDGGGVDEEQVEEPVGLQLEHMRARLGQGGFPLLGQQEQLYGADVTIFGVDGVVKCDRERVTKVLRKKKGGRCIYRIVVDHGNKVKTTHPGKRCDCTMYLDERWLYGGGELKLR